MEKTNDLQARAHYFQSFWCLYALPSIVPELVIWSREGGRRIFWEYLVWNKFILVFGFGFACFFRFNLPVLVVLVWVLVTASAPGYLSVVGQKEGATETGRD